MYGINVNPVLPVRLEPSEKAEMLTQLLFGELFSIIRVDEKWSFIRNNADSYEGWIDSKMITVIDESEYLQLSSHEPAQLFAPTAGCFIRTKNEPVTLPAGSRLYAYDNESGTVSINNNIYAIPAEAIMKRASQPASGHLVASIAKSFLNAPYLWGGKTAFGIDCSGLVQLCFSICGIQLPRDACQQALEGDLVESLEGAQTGDLAFFENNDGKITHVGILLDNSTIIHASGRVKIENVDTNGIIRHEIGTYSHRLSLIKRVILPPDRAVKLSY